MNQFEYLSVLISIILGLGMTYILVGVASLLKRAQDVTGYWVHSLQVITTFLYLVNQWWLVFGWADFPQITFFHHVFLMASPVSIFLASALLFPESGQGTVSLRDHYFAMARPYYGLMSLIWALDLVDTALKGLDRLAGLGAAYWPVMVVGFSTNVLAAFVRRPRFHAFVQPILLAVLVVSVILWKVDLSELLNR